MVTNDYKVIVNTEMQEIEKKWRGNLIKNHGACKNLDSLPEK